MQRVFETRNFVRWMRKTTLTNAALCEAVGEMVAGLVDADLGGQVLKKRVALPGTGKSGGARTLVATRRAERWFFVFGFEKNSRTNISDTELAAVQMLAADLLSLTPNQLNAAVHDCSLEEICHEPP